MRQTDVLIQHLSTRLTPVRPLARPWRRTLLWLAITAATIALMVAVIGLRPRLMAALMQPEAAVEFVLALATGLLAAIATFHVSLPGRSQRWAWLPVPAALLWMAGMGWGCLGEWWQHGPTALTLVPRLGCAKDIVLLSLPLSLVLLVMVRHAGAVRPVSTAALGALSAAALSSAGVDLVHPGETALMALIWHGGAVVVLAALAALASRRLFAWIGPYRVGSD